MSQPIAGSGPGEDGHRIGGPCKNTLAARHW
jgi:hypothetical protein